MLMNLPEVLKGQKPKMMRFKPIKVSRQTEFWYSRQLVTGVNVLRNQVERALQQPQSPFLMDSKDEFSAFDTQRFLSIIKKLAESDRLPKAEKLASEFVARGNQQNEREVGENLKRQTGVDLQDFLGNSPKLAEKIELMTTANVQLIKSIDNQYLDKVQTAVTQAVLAGKMPKELAQEIKEIGNVTEKRARFIARDQSAKLNGTLTQARHEELGITKYRWSTSGDERVRDSHAENDGKIFSYAEPPETGHPGQGINCRCVAIPVIDEIQGEKELKQREYQEIVEFRKSITEQQFEFHQKSIRSNDDVVAFIGKHKLNIDEAVVIREYTANGFFRLNRGLEFGKLESRDKSFAHILTRGLNKLPNYVGVVDRVVRFDNPEALQKAISRYIVGKVIIEKRFISTSKDVQQDTFSQLRFVIRSKSGKLIERISSIDIEKEVLFKPQTKFRVLSKKIVAHQTVIELEEV